MKIDYKYLKDDNFLSLIDDTHVLEQFIKITILDWLERPVQEVQGIVTGGSLNIAGNSSLRRTCNLSVFIDNRSDYLNILNVNNLFSINKKFYLEIGYKNTSGQYTEYETIWFPQGLYVITQCSIAHSTDGATISLQGKDKMCLLNGEVGGKIPASTQFDEYETIDENGKWIITKPTIVQIIRELVNHFGNEQLSKILISDIPLRLKQVVKWTGSDPIYYTETDNQGKISRELSLTPKENSVTFSYGKDIGYIYTDFTYPGELIGDAGSSVTDVLDKIKNTLGNYEYFYDIYGNFVFQEIKNYLNTTQATVELEKLKTGGIDYQIDMSRGKSIYKFDNGNLITSYNNNPQYNMIKNDFIVWGIRKNANGNSVQIRYHLAIDTKPKIGNIYDCFFYTDENDNITKAYLPIKFKDYNTLEAIGKGAAGVFYLTEDTNKVYKWDGKNFCEIDVEMVKVKTTDWRSELYFQGVQTEPFGTESNYYYTELLNEWPKIYNMQASKETITINGDKVEVYIGDFYPEVTQAIEDIDYYLDFIDLGAEISKFSVPSIGRRQTIVVDNDINCVFEPDVPDILIIETNTDETDKLREEAENKNQIYIQVSSAIYDSITIGGMSNSAYHKVRELLYQYTSYNESITIQSVPIYHLEPNTRIEVRDFESSIFGDYVISTMSIPLGVGGNMSISAIRALERI